MDGTLWDARHTVLKTWNEVFLKFRFDEVTPEELTLYTGLEQHEIIMNLLNTNYENAWELSSLLAIEEQKKIDRNVLSKTNHFLRFRKGELLASADDLFADFDRNRNF